MKNKSTNGTRSKNNKKQFLSGPIIVTVLILLLIAFAAHHLLSDDSIGTDIPKESDTQTTAPVSQGSFSYDDIPEYSSEPFCAVNGGIPYFTEDEITDVSYESYSSLDYLGRCGTAVSCVGRDLMPTEDRESIGHVKPTGWQSIQYDHVDGKSLYNRCHLIGFQLTGENANEKNLITGTRYMNVDGMLPFENMIADYVKETNNHVMYRVTPVFVGNELVARGVLMEGYSVEDEGEGVCFNVFAYNVQPLITINYSDGTSFETPREPSDGDTLYILNTKSKKFHLPSCSSSKSMSEKNKDEFTGDRSELIAMGYTPCGECDP